ncbi:hypothetical protein [Streptomyces sp. NPDC008001]|uniref:hypothetical protein n=1 Tax=Streptomyces sp. NPDC008001 TaxID=3364804 RepID=UPI0036E6693F
MTRTDITTGAGDGASSPDGRYARDMAAERRIMREAVRTDTVGAHIGLGVTVALLGACALASGPRWALVLGGALAAWFVLALGVVCVRGGRGWEIARRAYVATFGWGDYVS